MDMARTYLQLPLQQWGASNVCLLVLSSWKVKIEENPIDVMGLYIRSVNSPSLFAQMTGADLFFQVFRVLEISNFLLDTDVISGSAVQSFEIHYPAI